MKADRKRAAPEETVAEPEEETAEVPSEWLTTLADMSMLLMSFFVLLFSMSRLDLDKFAVSFFSVKSALTGPGAAGPQAPAASDAMAGLVEQTRLRQRALAEQRRVFDQFRAYAAERGLSGLVGATLEAGKISIVLPAGALFHKDGVDLTEEGRQRLTALYGFLVKAPGERVNIRGFTDDQPPAPGGRFRDNWEISSLRAVAVLRYLVSLGLPANRLTATGLADLEPLYPNTTPENRARNQRVEFALEHWIGE